MRVSAWPILLAIAMSVPPLAAQVVPRAGERVRVFASSGTSEGTLVALDTGAVRLVPRSGGEEHAIPLRAVARMEVHRGRRPAFGTGAAIGLGVGAVLGGTLAVAAADDCEPGVDPGCLDSGTQLIAGIGVGALAGAAVGAVIGAGLGQDAWAPVSLARPRFSARPTRGGGVRLSLTLSF